MDARWLKTKEAAAYSAFGQQKLKRLAREKKIVGFQDPTSKRGDWIFDRRSLDAFREQHFIPLASNEIDQKFLEIFGDSF